VRGQRLEAMSDLDSRDARRLAAAIDRFNDWVEEHEIGECLNDLADHAEKLLGILSQVSKVEGGVGIARTILDGLSRFAAAHPVEPRRRT
jgi:hypothetical protein